MSSIPPVDPTEPPTLTKKILHRISNTAAGRWFGINASTKVDPVLMKLTGGRVSTTAFFPLVLLAVRGRRSGLERIVPLVYFTRGEEVILVASSFGRAKHPAWYLNVKASPEVELIHKGRRLPYVARETEGAERERLFALARRLYEGYAGYEQRTEGVRRIPVLALRPREAA